MKNQILASFISLFVLTSLNSCGSLHSVTRIDSNASFVLGEGKHGAYKAIVRNVGKQDVAIYQQPAGMMEPVYLGVLKPGESARYPVASNTKIVLKNQGNGEAQMELKVKGDTDLSMGYQ